MGIDAPSVKIAIFKFCKLKTFPHAQSTSIYQDVHWHSLGRRD